MKQATRTLALLATTLAMTLLALPANGDCGVPFRRVVHHAPVEKAVVVPVVATFVPVAVPLYSAVYQAAQAGTYGPSPLPASAPVASGNQEVLAAVKELALAVSQMNERVLRLERGQPGVLPQPGAAPMPLAEPPAKLPVTPGAGLKAGAGFAQHAIANCASCHEQNKAQASGGGFVLLTQGKVAPLTPAQAEEVVKRLTLPETDPKAMPVGRKMAPQAKLEMIQSLIRDLQEQQTAVSVMLHGRRGLFR